MRKLALGAALAASVAVTGCATYPNQYGYDAYGNPVYANGYNNGYYNNGYYNNGNSQAANAVTGAAVGAVGGAIAGKIIPGVSTGQGAIAGAILGGVLGATVNGRQYYRDTRGYCYYVDQYGSRVTATISAANSALYHPFLSCLDGAEVTFRLVEHVKATFGDREMRAMEL